jgi:hypothetical protein
MNADGRYVSEVLRAEAELLSSNDTHEVIADRLGISPDVVRAYCNHLVQRFRLPRCTHVPHGDARTQQFPAQLQPYGYQRPYGQQPRQLSFAPDPQYGTPSGQPTYQGQPSPRQQSYRGAPYGQQPWPPAEGRPRQESWPRRHKVLTVLGGVAALIIVIAGVASASGNAKQADNASTVATTTPTRTATPSRAPTHHAVSAKAVPVKPPVTVQAAAPAPATTAPAPVTTSHAAAPPPPAATTPAGCYPLTSGGNCYEPGEYCRDADHGASGVAGDGEAITCKDNDGWRWEPS